MKSIISMLVKSMNEIAREEGKPVVYSTPHCIVYAIRNLKTVFDEAKGKWFQTFDAGPFKLVTGKHYEEGQLGVVIPANAIVPDDIAKEMWLYGKLAGKKRNRVAPKMMFGHRSEAIFYAERWTDEDGTLQRSNKWQTDWKEGDNVTAALGVTFRDNDSNRLA
jgi:hypothetical protein